jgi:hypothetical protein
MEKIDKSLKDIQRKITQYDSSTAILHALSLYLQDKDFIGVGVTPTTPPWIGTLINAIPQQSRLAFYRFTGWKEALPKKDLTDLTTEDMARWAVSKYAPVKYPALLFGSSNGAVAHLGAALQAPWLPQTFLTAVRRELPADEIKKDIVWGKEIIKPVLDANPNLAAHQMHDPLQDRLMVRCMGYFRLKLLAWEKAYQQFAQTQLEPQAPMISIECRYPWPVYQVQERHTFQLGGFGGLSAHEYLEGGEKVRTFLENIQAPVRKWDTFAPNCDLSEAEWGFREELFHSAKKFAQENGRALYRLIFDHPEGLSPFIADLYDWWYRKRGIESNSIFLESFGLIEPRRTILSHSIPLWLAFNTDVSAKLAEDYLRYRPFDYIFLMLMSNGVKEGIGLTTIDRWRAILKQAKIKGDFIGVDSAQYPLDFGIFLKYHSEILKKMSFYPHVPQPLSFDELEEFIQLHPGKYPFQWEKVLSRPD